MAGLSFFKKPAAWLGRIFKRGGAASYSAGGRGVLVFANTSEVIAAERLLRGAGLDVSVKGPPPELRTGCDLVVTFPLLKQAEAERLLSQSGLTPDKILVESDLYLEPVSLFESKDFGSWLMVRAANIKVTIDKSSGIIVNISGGGCPDVPWLAREMTGKTLEEAPEPLSLGHTLCCYCLQKAFEELRRIRSCG